MKLVILSALLLFLVPSCNMSDDYHELGSGFTYIGEGGEMNYISGGDAQHNTEILGKITRFNSNEAYIIAEQIPSKNEYRQAIGLDLGVDYYRYNDFIRDSIEWKQYWSTKEVSKIRKFQLMYIFLKNMRVSFENTENDMIKCEIVADSLLNNENYYKNIFSRKINYWIIDKNKNYGYGPMDSLQFANNCERLEIIIPLERHNY